MVEFTEKPIITGQYADGRALYETTPAIELPVPGAPIQDVYAGLVTLEEALARYNAYKERIENSERTALWVGFTRKTEFFLLGYHVDLDTGITIYFQNRFFDHKNPPAAEA